MRLLSIVLLTLLLVGPCAPGRADVILGGDTLRPVGPTNPIYAANDGIPLASMTSTRAAIQNGAFSVALSAPATHFILWTDTGSADVHVAFTSPASTSNAKLSADRGLTVETGQKISTLYLYGAAATGNLNVIAW